MRIIYSQLLDQGSLAYVVTMAPRETEAVPCGPSSLAQLKAFDKALKLPVVSDVASKLASHQLKGVVEGVSSLVTQAEESLPARLRHCSDTAKEKVGSAVEGLDSLACDGLDQLTTNIPALKGTSSELCEVTKVTRLQLAAAFKSMISTCPHLSGCGVLLPGKNQGLPCQFHRGSEGAPPGRQGITGY